MAKFPFVFETWVDSVNLKGLAERWLIRFMFDDFENEVTFQSGSRSCLSKPLDWEDFLKEVNKEADGDFVNALYEKALDHVENNLNDVYYDDLICYEDE